MKELYTLNMPPSMTSAVVREVRGGLLGNPSSMSESDCLPLSLENSSL